MKVLFSNLTGQNIDGEVLDSNDSKLADLVIPPGQSSCNDIADANQFTFACGPQFYFWDYPQAETISVTWILHNGTPVGYFSAQ